MNPEMTNDPTVLAVLASLAVVAFTVQTWAKRPRKPQHRDAPRENRWRNRWH